MKISLIKQLVMATAFLLMLALPIWLGGKDSLQLLTHIPLSFVALFITLTLLKWGTLTLRWQKLLSVGGHSARPARIFPIVLASDFISENTPTHLGAIACNILFFKKEGVPASATTAYCNLIFILDLAAVFLSLSIFTLLASQANSLNLIWLSLGCLGLVALILGWMVFLLKHAENLSYQLIRSPLQHLFPKRYHKPIRTFLLYLRKRLIQTATLPLKQLLLLFLFSLIHWSIRFSLLYLAILAVGGTASWPITAIVQFVSGLAGMMTFLPGGFPGTDLSLLVLLHKLQPAGILLPALLLWRVVTYHVNFLAGSIALLWLGNHVSVATLRQNRS